MMSSAVSSFVQTSGPSILGGGDFDFYASQDFQTIFFGTISGDITAELTGEDGALKKCPMDIFSERASMCRERQGAVYEQTKSHSTKIVKPLHTLFYNLFSQLPRNF